MVRERIKSMSFDGDIIITDPCYITKDRDAWYKEHPDDWEVCSYGCKMSKLGIKHALTNGTIYGDWSCTTFEDKTNKVLGEFCADAGMVGIFLLAEVLKYNPRFDNHIKRPWTTTLIKNFKGTVYIEKTTTKNDKYIRVIGEGVDKVTGHPLCFHTEQTGF